MRNIKLQTSNFNQASIPKLQVEALAGLRLEYRSFFEVWGLKFEVSASEIGTPL
jgi:hypothetical protein